MARATPYDRAKSLQSAISLFWEKGYYAASLKDIEARLKMKPGSIYAAFGSKEALYIEALDTYFAQSLGGFRALMAKHSSPLEGLAQNLWSFAELPTTHQARRACMLAKSIVDTRDTDPRIAQAAQSRLAAIKSEFAAAFRKAKELGELGDDADADFMAVRYQAAINAIRFEIHTGVQPETLEKLIEHLAQSMGLPERPKPAD